MNKKKILVADDEENLRILVRTTLDDPACMILEAGDGNETIWIARAEHPDLILLDWMMPGISGIDVLKILHQDRQTADIPVIMLTAKAQQKDRELGLSVGARAYLVKPFSPLELMAKVQEVLG